jgi:Fic family protein
MRRIDVGRWRTDAAGPMRVISGAFGRERVRYTAPSADRVADEMQALLSWIEAPSSFDPVLVAAQAHLWFVTIHPFDDGNGRIGRAIADLALARSERSAHRFYSLSAQIRAERTAYYRVLERTQQGDGEVTPWLLWFLACLGRAIDGAQATLSTVLRKAACWKSWATASLNARQVKVLNRLLDGFVGKLTSSKWATLSACSQDTAARDIADLVAAGILRKGDGGGRSTHYVLVEPAS